MAGPVFGKREESNEDSKRDGVSDLQLQLTYESLNSQKVATCEFQIKPLKIQIVHLQIHDL